MSNSPEHTRILDAKTLLRIIRANLALITAFAIVVGMLTSLVVYRMPSIYRSTAVLLIEPDKKEGVGLEALFAEGAFSREYFETQRELLMSYALAERVVKRHQLATWSEFQIPDTLAWWQGDLRRHLPGLSQDPQLKRELSAEQEIQFAANMLQRALSVTAVPRTQLVKISIDLNNPEHAQLAAEYVAQAYIESGLEARLSKTQTANAWFSSRLSELKEALGVSEAKLQRFLDNNELVDVGGVRGLLENDIQSNNASLLQARKTVARLKAVVEEIRAAQGRASRLQSIKALSGDDRVRSTRESYLRLKQQYDTISQRYGARHPERVQAATELQAAQDAYERQLQAAADGLVTEYEFARREVQDLTRFAERNKTDLQAVARKSYELRALEREVDLNRQMYDLFLEKVKQTDLSEDFESVNAVIVDPPRLPGSPSEPRRKLIILASLLMGYVLGYALLLVRWGLYERIDTPDDLVNLIGDTPLLGSLPLIKALDGSLSPRKLRKALISEAPLIEGAQSLRTSLLLSDPDKRCKSIMITSSIPGEGKSTVSMALGYSFARMAKTLVIEADLRKPRLAEAGGLERNSEGLVAYMLEDRRLEELASPIAENLYLLPAGGHPPNPLELLSSNKFARLLEEAAEHFDRILIDSPPVEVVSDALAIASSVDQYMLIVGAGKTDAKLTQHALQQISRVNAKKLAGVVLNQVNIKKITQYYGGRYAGYKAADYYRA